MVKRSFFSFLRGGQEAKNNVKECDNEGCFKEAYYKAPKNIALSQYYCFCLEHVQKYNASWNYYEGMSTLEIDRSRKDDLTWNRPTWSFRKGPYKKIIEEIQLDYGQEEAANVFSVYEPKVSLEVQGALRTLHLHLPLTLEELKKRYRELVKCYHPDLRIASEAPHVQEEMIKQINHAHATLRSFLQQAKKDV